MFGDYLKEGLSPALTFWAEPAAANEHPQSFSPRSCRPDWTWACPYTIDHYPTGQNPRTGLPWSPATDGLRNLTGRVSRDGTVTIWAITSTVSGNGDQGADPNKLVKITDKLAATSLPAGESFVTVETARFAEVLRGVSHTPGTGISCGERRTREDACEDDDDDH
jgi:hypothetical protein